MGNRIGKIGVCFTGSDHRRHQRSEFNAYIPDPYDEGIGTSFCYVRPDPSKMPTTSNSKIHSEESSASIFRSISGASVSANTSTPPLSMDPTAVVSGPIFESSTYFASVPLQPIPRPFDPLSGPISDRGFMSGPIERPGAGFLSGPLERPIFSGPLDRSFSHGGGGGSWGSSKRKGSIIRGLRRAISKTLRQNYSVVAPVKWVLGHDSWTVADTKNNSVVGNSNENMTASGSLSLSLDETESWESQNLQVHWAQGKAGEDRVHVVVSEEHGWVFVGIYDGFNGPDATDFLLFNLYSYVQKELKGLLWDENPKSDSSSSIVSVVTQNSSESRSSSCSSSDMEASVSQSFYSENYSSGVESGSLRRRNSKGKYSGVANKWEENQRRLKCEWDRERLELDRRLKEQWNRNDGSKTTNHSDVLKALSQALKKTEEAYFDIADKMLDENPELALMGSCVLVMLMKGEDVYVMNVGDSTAVLAQKKEPDLRLGKIDQDLERINEESLFDFQVSDGVKPSLKAYQLTFDHSTAAEEEVLRIREEHPDDACAVVNDRVKGSLKVTRAFGAGFLKQPKWNEALLEMFRIDYIGTSPYINCQPSLYHHRLEPKDQFLILSSDGLYQYFTNEEAIAEVELFITLSPEGDPAQHLVEEVLLRAAKKAGMDLYELLDIPQGDRRKYHDDVSIIIISFEGRIWRSSV